MHARLLPALLLATLALGGCATGALDIGTADRTVTPAEAARNITLVRGRAVAWGGTIVSTKNLADRTEIEVVGYALDDQNRPRAEGTPTGRFIASHTGYLESATYAPGRQVTVIGTASGTHMGKVGEASYVYPVVTATRVHLWPKPGAPRSDPQLHFGIGIGIHR